MAGMMKAAICKQAKQPVVIEEIPIPEPIGRQIQARVKAASLCHSDLTIISDGFSIKDTFPVILGHEAVSVVEKLGPAAASYGFREGDLIGASLWHGMCLSCEDCKTAGPDFCPNKGIVGVTRPGSFAEYTLVDPESAVLIARTGDDGGYGAEIIPRPAAISPLFCAGITAWDAVERAHLHPGETVAVVGAGGLGELAIRYAHALGGHVLTLDVRDEQLQACKDSTDAIINTHTLSPDALEDRIHQSTGRRSVDVAIVTAGTVPAYQTAFNILKPMGRLIVVGLPTEPLPLPFAAVGMKALSIIGARAPGRNTAKRCLDFSLRRKILPRVNSRIFRLEEINEMVALMEAGQVEEGRMVIEFP